MITYNNLYLDIRRSLLRIGVSAASLEAREIVCCASGKTREELFRDLQLYASEEAESRARELLERRLAGEPVAYLIGEWEFYGLPLYIAAGVLIPRTDTEVLAGAAIDFLGGGENKRLLDLCAGSGCVGLAVAANVPGCRAVLADWYEEPLRLCRQNIRRNELSGRVTCLRADALSAPDPSLGEFDCIACNPPYIPAGELAGLDSSVRCYEPETALDGGEDGLRFYRAVTSLWGAALRPGGKLMLECGAGQAGQVEKLLQRNGFGDITTLPDGQGILRVVMGTAGIPL